MRYDNVTKIIQNDRKVNFNQNIPWAKPNKLGERIAGTRNRRNTVPLEKVRQNKG